MFITSMRVSES